MTREQRPPAAPQPGSPRGRGRGGSGCRWSLRARAPAGRPPPAGSPRGAHALGSGAHRKGGRSGQGPAARAERVRSADPAAARASVRCAPRVCTCGPAPLAPGLPPKCQERPAPPTATQLRGDSTHGADLVAGKCPDDRTQLQSPHQEASPSLAAPLLKRNCAGVGGWSWAFCPSPPWDFPHFVPSRQILENGQKKNKRDWSQVTSSTLVLPGRSLSLATATPLEPGSVEVSTRRGAHPGRCRLSRRPAASWESVLGVTAFGRFPAPWSSRISASPLSWQFGHSYPTSFRVHERPSSSATKQMHNVGKKQNRGGRHRFAVYMPSVHGEHLPWLGGLEPLTDAGKGETRQGCSSVPGGFYFH